jgi:hypothetical protein
MVPYLILRKNMQTRHRFVLLLGALCLVPTIAGAQIFQLSERDRSGPRFGVAYIAGGSVTAERLGESLSPVVSLFGWQVEHVFPTGEENLPTPIIQVVGLIGGLEQGRSLPSLSAIIGLRGSSGWEAGVGPTLTGAGAQLAFAVGKTVPFGWLNVPMNLAVAPGRRGASISFTTGFTRH